MKTPALFSVLVMLTITSTTIVAQETIEMDSTIRLGESLFNEECIACHTLGKLSYGPDLKVSVEVRTTEWFIQFTRSQREMIIAKDSIATQLFYDYNQAMHTEHDLTNKQILAIIEYIKNEKD